MPFFSIVIPVFNKVKFVDKTLNSVLEQTFADFEIIIVNDGSTDDSEAKVSLFKDNRIKYFSKENEGVSATRNLGIEKASADFICFLDADDYWFPSFLETIHAYIQKLPEQKVFATAYEIETSKNRFPSQYSIKKTNEFELVNYFQASTKDSVLWTSSAAFHKEVFATAGNFNIGLSNLEDIDLWIRIGLKYPIVLIWKVQARYNFDVSGLSKNKFVGAANIDFSEYNILEKTDSYLKFYLDLNRFSLAIKSKLVNDSSNFQIYYNAIDLTKFPLKKRIILNLPRFALRLFISFKQHLVNIGLGKSVFR